MKINKIRFFTILSTFFCLLWAAGLALVFIEYYSSEQQPIPNNTDIPEAEKKEGDLIVVALGDSLTRGTGDSSGKGYVGYVREELEEKSAQPVTLFNLGIRGQRSGQLVNQVQETQVKNQLKQADYILITIGGNDLFQGGQTLLDADQDTIEKLQKDYLSNLSSIFQEIRSANKEATIFFVGLYNPFLELDDSKETSDVVRLWNYNSAELAADYQGIVFVPTFDLFELNVADYLYTDQFHPNKAGHQIIAERVASLITWQ